MSFEIITKKQIIAIKTLSDKLGLTDAEEDEMLYGNSSVSNLSKRQASALIGELSKRCENNPPKHKPRTGYTGKGSKGQQMHLTQPQAERIGLMKTLLGWSDAGIQSFIHRQIKKLKGVDMLMSFEASKVIVGMGRVYADKNKDLFLTINKMTNTELLGLINKAKEAK